MAIASDGAAAATVSGGAAPGAADAAESHLAAEAPVSHDATVQTLQPATQSVVHVPNPESSLPSEIDLIPGLVLSTRAPFDLTGEWALDRSRSESLQPMLEAMGIGPVWRRLMDSADIVSTITHARHALRIADTSPYGSSATDFILDWKSRTYVGVDQKEVRYRACVLPGLDELPLGEPAGSVVKRLRPNPPPPPEGLGGAYPRYGAGSGVQITESVLSDELGLTWDERHLCDPYTLRVVTTYLRAGVAVTRITRYLVRRGDVPLAVLETPAASELSNGPVESVLDSAIPALVRSASNADIVCATPLRESPTTSSVQDATATVSSPLKAPASDTAQLDGSRQTIASVAAVAPRMSIASSPRLSFAVPAGASPDSKWSARAWVPDAEARSCGICQQTFSAFLRIHHCRSCGGVFCDAHSLARIPLPHLAPDVLQKAGLRRDTLVRVCDRCATPVVECTATDVPTSGGILNVSGWNLGTQADADDGRVTLALADASAMRLGPVRFQTPHLAFCFPVPPGVGTRSVRLTVNERQVEFTFVYATPTLISADASDTDGGVISLRGVNLGAAQDAITASLDDTPLPIERLVRAHAEVQVRIPSGTGAGHALTVCVGGTPCLQPLLFSYARPTLYAIRCVIESHRVNGCAQGSSDDASNSLTSSRGFVPVAYLYGSNLGADVTRIAVHVRGVPVDAALVELVLPHSKLRIVLPAPQVSSPSPASRTDSATVEADRGTSAAAHHVTALLLSDVRISVSGLDYSLE